MHISGMPAEMKNKYQELIDVPDAVIFTLDRDKNYISLNPEWTDLTGCLIEKTLGRSFFTYVQESDLPFLEQQFQSLIDGLEDGFHTETAVVGKQGKLERVHLFLRADMDVTGKVISFSGTLTSLSSREENIDSYKKDIQNYRLISENMLDMVAVMAVDGLVLYASPSHTTTLGLDLEEYVGSYPIKHIHPDDQERMFHFFHKMVENWSPLDVEYRCLHQDGRWLDLEMRCTPIKNSHDEIQIIAVSRDITQRKKAEEELRQATMKFKTLIGSLPYGVKVENEKGEVTLYNDAYSDIVLQKKAISDVNQEEAARVAGDEAFYMYQRKEIVRHRRECRAEEIYLKSGQIIERDAIPMMDNGHFDGYMWIYRDITAKKEAEEKLQKANKDLQELSMLDGLTGIANRRCFDTAVRREWEKCAALKQPVSLLLLDIDLFKVFNDFYGHQAGDKCLEQVGKILRELPQHPDDLVARYGGEEFVVLLPGKPLEQAVQTAEAIQTAVKKGYISHKGSFVNESLTVSIGISTKKPAPGSNPCEIVGEADQALYQAKRNGRNQYIVFS